MDEEMEEQQQIHLYLDFGGKINRELIEKPNLFLRLADLETAQPLVQVNDILFRGAYEDCLGTNLFFEEVQEETRKGPFEPDTPIALNYLKKQTKTLKLREVEVGKKGLDETDIDSSFNLNLNQNYGEVLRKLQDGALSLETLKAPLSWPNTCGIVTGKEPRPVSVPDPVAIENVLEPLSETTELTAQAQPTRVELNLNLLRKYESLKRLAKRAVHRESLEETIAENRDTKQSFDLHDIECQILQRSDSFPFVDFNVDYETLENIADVERCELLGIIEASGELFPRPLRPEEKEKILRFECFPYLSTVGRYFVLKRELDGLRSCEGDGEVDEFGRTPRETREILEKLVAKLERYLQTYKEIDEAAG